MEECVLCGGFVNTCPHCEGLFHLGSAGALCSWCYPDALGEPEDCPVPKTLKAAKCDAAGLAEAEEAAVAVVSGWVCVHDHLGGASHLAARLPGAIEATVDIAHVPAAQLKPGALVPGGPYPQHGRRDMALACGVRATDRAGCPNAVCRAAEARRAAPEGDAE